jgi:hypothetical protein
MEFSNNPSETSIHEPKSICVGSVVTPEAYILPNCEFDLLIANPDQFGQLDLVNWLRKNPNRNVCVLVIPYAENAITLGDYQLQSTKGRMYGKLENHKPGTRFKAVVLDRSNEPNPNSELNPDEWIWPCQFYPGWQCIYANAMCSNRLQIYMTPNGMTYLETLIYSKLNKDKSLFEIICEVRSETRFKWDEIEMTVLNMLNIRKETNLAYMYVEKPDIFIPCLPGIQKRRMIIWLLELLENGYAMDPSPEPLNLRLFSESRIRKITNYEQFGKLWIDEQLKCLCHKKPVSDEAIWFWFNYQVFLPLSKIDRNKMILQNSRLDPQKVFSLTIGELSSESLLFGNSGEDSQAVVELKNKLKLAFSKQ